MFEWFVSLFAPQEPEPKYQIVHDAEFGYAACYWEFEDWHAIYEDGRSGLDLKTVSSPGYSQYFWCETTEQAGERINKHATSRGQKTVWSA